MVVGCFFFVRVAAKLEPLKRLYMFESVDVTRMFSFASVRSLVHVWRRCNSLFMKLHNIPQRKRL